ncbi:hypothetical protein B0H63DRAFT_499779 [Podospora didyma]|uniref:Uncharacterized protein n=1 Tax=Podospora didyma TaxID=330526 RepID=A0AAE0U487_9PEZI|nr:hypothetical protein B0H63DRAFT_499779 [Podospora didyma]
MLMINVGRFRSLNVHTSTKRLFWAQGKMSDFVRDLFQPQTAQALERGKFDALFTTRNLSRIAGFKVKLTTNLADHLRFRDSDKAITIFHHATFLKCQLQNPIYPAGFVAETLQTLALLFPENDANTRKWILKCGIIHRRIENYLFWHHRLVVLKDDFNDAQPTTLWYTLWFAISLAIFLGLVQSIEGGMQVYQSWPKAG